MYRLIIEDDEGRTTVVPLIRNQINIGREEGNTIRLTERNISRRHAKLMLKDGQILVEDLKSYNGVWLNGNRVKGRSAIRPGDLMEIGDYHLSVHEESADEDQKAVSTRKSPYKPEEITPPLGVPQVEDPQLENKEPIAHPEPAILLLQNTSQQGRIFTVEWPTVTIGRTDENDIAIDHPSVTRKHAKILCEDGIYRLYDLDSANGVQVNGEEYKTCDLRFGDIIELGEVRFRFCSIHEDLQALLPKLPATSEQKSPASLSSNAMIVIATVLILIGGGAIWVMTRSAKISEQTKAQKLDPPDLQKPPEHIKSKEISIQEEQQKQLKLAEDMFEQENYDVAVVILDKLLVQRADWQEAKKLKQRIEYEQTQLKHIQTSIALQIEGKMLQAYETLDQIHKESRFFDRASDSKKEIAPKAVDELMHKVQEAIEHKQYINALQLNNQARDILPLHPKAKEFHEQLEQLIPKISEGNMLSSNKSMPRVTTSSALPKPRRGLSPVDKCQTLIRNKRYQSAKNCLDALVKQLGQKAPSQVHFLLGETTAQLGQCFDVIEKQKHILCFEAREHYRRYLKLAPNTPSAAKVRKMLNTTTTTPPKD